MALRLELGKITADVAESATARCGFCLSLGQCVFVKRGNKVSLVLNSPLLRSIQDQQDQQFNACVLGSSTDQPCQIVLSFEKADSHSRLVAECVNAGITLDLATVKQLMNLGLLVTRAPDLNVPKRPQSQSQSTAMPCTLDVRASVVGLKIACPPFSLHASVFGKVSVSKSTEAQLLIEGLLLDSAAPASTPAEQVSLPSRVLHPVSASASVTSWEGRPPSVAVTLGQLVVDLTIHDLRDALCLGEQFAHAADDSEACTVNAVPPTILSTLSESSGQAPKRPARVAFPNVSVKTGGLKLMFMGGAPDAEHLVPMLRARLMACDLLTHNCSRKLLKCSVLNAILSVDSFNVGLACWEPLVEAFRWTLEAELPLGAKNAPCSVTLNCADTIGVNVTKTVVEHIVNLCGQLENLPPQMRFHPLGVSNQTGTTLHFISSKKLPQAPLLVYDCGDLAPGEEAPVAHSLGPTVAAKKLCGLEVAVRLDGFATIRALSFSYPSPQRINLLPTSLPASPGASPRSIQASPPPSPSSAVMRAYTPPPSPSPFRVLLDRASTPPPALPLLLPSDDEAPARPAVVCEVESKCGRKVLAVHSLLTLRSALRGLVRFAAVPRDADLEVCWSPPVEAGGTWAIQARMLCIKNCELRVKIGDFVVTLLEELCCVGAAPMTPQLHHSPSRDFHFITKLTCVNAATDAERYVLWLAPPLIVENLLAMPLVVLTLWGGDVMQPTSQLDVPPGELVNVHLTKQPLTLSFLLQGYTRSSPVVVGDRTCHVQVTCSEAGRSRKHFLDVDMRVDEFGTKHVTVFTRYWLVNSCGLDAVFYDTAGADVAGSPTESLDVTLGQDQLIWYRDQWQGDLPLLYSPALSAPSSKLCLRFPQSKNSKFFEADTVGLNQEVTVSHRKSVITRFQFAVSVSTAIAPSQFWRTKIVTVAPQLILHNAVGQDLYYRQSEIHSSRFCNLPDGAQLPFHWRHHFVKQLTLSLDPTLQQNWCHPFSLTHVGRFSVRLLNVACVGGDTDLFVWVDICPRGQSVLVQFTCCPTQCPEYRIVNNSAGSVFISQQDGSADVHEVRPNSVVPFAWDNPNGTRRLAIQIGAVESKPLNLDKVTSCTLDIPSAAGAPYIVYTSFDGPVKVLTIQPADQMDPNAVPSGEDVPSGPSDVLSVHANLRMSRLGFTMFDTANQELLSAWLTELRCALATDADHRSLQCSVVDAQIDNQIASTLFPVLLAQTNPSPDRCVFSLSFLETMRSPSVHHITYLSALLQELDMRVDDTLIALSDWLRIRPAVPSMSPPPVFGKNWFWDKLTLNQPAKVVHLELMHLHPIKLNLTSSSRSRPVQAQDIPASLVTLGQLLTVDHVPITLSVVYLENMFLSQNKLVNILSRYYRNQLLQQVYNVLLGLDCIGAPLSLWRLCGKGLQDFFYEPTLGLVKSPEDFAKGLSKGTRSLIRNNVIGIFNSSGKLLGSLSDGVARITFDEEFQQSRTRSAHDTPRHVGDGLLCGSMDLGKGVLFGVTGVLSEPFRGAQKEGFGGLVKGLGRGVVGAMFKPAVGVLDFAAQTATGIKNTASFCEQKQLVRVRPPRFTRAGLRPYDDRLANARQLLLELSLDEAEVQTMVGAVQVLFGTRCERAEVIATATRVLCVPLTPPSPSTDNAAHGTPPTVAWQVQARDLVSVQLVGCELVLSTSQLKVLKVTVANATAASTFVQQLRLIHRK
eukprot:TRINITY_DN815_c0_g1_i4.p1 TRINITY_DN815_c0_g1~~TRINITY_DN815_c0_g1_i4.p1  ORF type:complete len:1918 (+),score=318.22 TRINITY_DN815_c0_g1_i4:637-5754(+)